MKRSCQKSFFSTAIALLLTNIAIAQRDTTLNQPNQSGTFVAPHSIVLSPGFSAAAGAPFRAYIDPILGTCVALNTALSNNQNYIATYTPRVAGIMNPVSLRYCSANPLAKYHVAT